jgi:Zn-dependent protease with chaperone function
VRTTIEDTKGLWLIKGDLHDVDTVLNQCLQEYRLDVNRNEDSGDIVIEAKTQLSTLRLLITRHFPETVRFSLKQKTPKQILLELSYGYSIKFLIFAFFLLFVSGGVMVAPIYLAKYYRIIYSFPVTVSSSLIGFFCFMAIIYRLILLNFPRKLYGKFIENGFPVQIIKNVALPQQSVPIFFVWLSIVSFFMTACLSGATLTLLFVCVIWIITFFLLFYPVSGGGSKIPLLAVSLNFSFIFALYGFASLLMLNASGNIGVKFGISIVILCFILYGIAVKFMVGSLNSLVFIKQNIKQTAKQQRSTALVFTVVILWIPMSVGCFCTGILSLMILEYCLLGNNYLFPVEIASTIVQNMSAILGTILFSRILLIMYSMPIVILVSVTVIHNLKMIVEYIKILCQKRPCSDEMKILLSTIQEISHLAKIHPPRVRIIPSNNINAFCVMPLVPGLPQIVVVTSEALKLPHEQQYALIAHEIGHISAAHSTLYSILHFVSRWTFAGEGFPSLLCKDTMTMEFEADEFAIHCMPQKKDALSSLIKTCEKQRVKQLLSGLSHNEIASLSGFSIRNKADELLQDFAEYSNLSFLKKQYFHIRIFCFFYYHGWLATYTHIPYDVRLKYIDKIIFGEDNEKQTD